MPRSREKAKRRRRRRRNLWRKANTQKPFEGSTTRSREETERNATARNRQTTTDRKLETRTSPGSHDVSSRKYNNVVAVITRRMRLNSPGSISPSGEREQKLNSDSEARNERCQLCCDATFAVWVRVLAPEEKFSFISFSFPCFHHDDDGSVSRFPKGSARPVPMTYGVNAVSKRRDGCTRHTNKGNPGTTGGTREGLS